MKAGKHDSYTSTRHCNASTLTMSNQICVRVHTQRGDEMLCEATCHIYLYEAGGAAVHSGVTSRSLEGDYGILDANMGSTPLPGIAWLSGDADLDGSVTPGDFGILDANINMTPVLNPATSAVLRRFKCSRRR